MTPSSPRRGLALLALPLFVVAAANVTASASAPPGSSVPGDAGGSAGDSSVVIHDEGTGDQRVNLNDVPVTVGAVLHSVKTNEATGEIHMSGAETLDATVAGTTTVEQSAEVTEVAPDGGFTVVRTVDSYEFVVTEGPEQLGSFLQDDEELAPLVGIPVVQVYDADQVLLSATPADPNVTLTADQQAALDEIIADGADAARLPDADLGVGARWTAFLQGSKGVTAEYELLSLSDTEAGIGVTVDGDAASMIDPESPLEDVAGTVTGAGSLTFDLTDALAGDIQLALTIAMTGTTQGITFDMTLDSTTTQTVTAG